jgi:hypothetical protein
MVENVSAHPAPLGPVVAAERIGCQLSLLAGGSLLPVFVVPIVLAIGDIPIVLQPFLALSDVLLGQLRAADPVVRIVALYILHGLDAFHPFQVLGPLNLFRVYWSIQLHPIVGLETGQPHRLSIDLFLEDGLRHATVLSLGT